MSGASVSRVVFDAPQFASADNLAHDCSYCSAAQPTRRFCIHLACANASMRGCTRCKTPVCSSSRLCLQSVSCLEKPPIGSPELSFGVGRAVLVAGDRRGAWAPGSSPSLCWQRRWFSSSFLLVNLVSRVLCLQRYVSVPLCGISGPIVWTRITLLGCSTGMAPTWCLTIRSGAGVGGQDGLRRPRR
jgi:hypothetical protein